ncbi:MAG: 3-deoxy-manno-octulosonate cytidylyltransferase [Gemmatimonadetes bacterium]|nr:3-deoxy-manno-octulosonate cytidylyltransferase [Gemmatimonadota bacterium]MCY3613246.1 3-deoxy-manno-octulosonate cytidylyltransferase [Gemmatimonadota bacterium]MCY3678784.1 3-deoxy-manno-octulosonate cytidylyltransferase [Gemmatimonadota bacterium]MYA42353.1 3-deoxy-manno-octulosonate cytidylyltransferase [Gemmatimonadota bacterium]MYE92127.1 3-deoxy-manno-octulosonate cytidylyltransferase [Gemmatimonadota bacterium]
MSRVLGVIPARIGSFRLPRKPLQPLLGKPLVVWVWERARSMDFLDRVVVATDSNEVAEACRQAGAEVLLTSRSHPSGTDRVHEVAARLNAGFDVVLNIQGDEPLVQAGALRAAVSMVQDGFEVGTCATPIRSQRELEDPSVVKVVRTLAGSALYFSRAPIPHRYGPAPEGREPGRDGHLRHVGVYAYEPDALERWVRFGRSRLETEEGLEQLRALENGMRIGVAVLEEAAHGVDTPEDLARLERRLRMGNVTANTTQGATATE